jgi:signal transduction histidine kinase
LIVRRDETGCISKAEPAQFRVEQLREKSASGGLTRSLGLFPNFPSRAGSAGFEIIGTIEAGYDNSEKSEWREVTSEQAQILFDRCCSYANDLRCATLYHVVDVITESAREIAGADFASFYYPFAPDHGRHSYETWAGASRIRPFRPREDGLGWRAISQMEARFLRASESETVQPVRFSPEASAAGIRSIAAIPLIIDAGYSPLLHQLSRQIDAGVLYVGLVEDRAFSNEEKYGLTLFTKLAADAISRAVYYGQAMNSARQLASLHSMASALAHETDTQGLLYSIAGHAQNILTADIVVIYEYDDLEKHFFLTPAVSGRCETGFDDYLPPPALVEKPGIKVAHSPQEVSALLGAGDDERRPRHFVAKEGIVAAAAVPLRFADEAVGVMFVAYRHDREFPRYEADAIEILASTAAVAIRNRRLLISREDSVRAMSHQLRNPIWALSVMATGLRKDLDAIPYDYDLISGQVNEIANQLDILDGLTEGLFASLTLEARRHRERRTVPSEYRSVNTHEEIIRLWTLLQSIRCANDLDLEICDGEAHLPVIKTNPVVFRNVVYSLLDNAMKYADRKSLVKVDWEHESGEYALFKVNSIGQAIGADEREKIFWKFGRSRNSDEIRPSRGGMGIGLWIARHHLQSVGGEIWLELDVRNPRSSMFVVQLPVQSA